MRQRVLRWQWRRTGPFTQIFSVSEAHKHRNCNLDNRLMTLVIYSTWAWSANHCQRFDPQCQHCHCTYYTVAALSCVLYFHRTAFNIGTQRCRRWFCLQLLRWFWCGRNSSGMEHDGSNYGSSGSIAGVGTVFLIGVVALFLGVPLMVFWNVREPDSFWARHFPWKGAYGVDNRDGFEKLQNLLSKSKEWNTLY